jgi:hypothetical protein
LNDEQLDSLPLNHAHNYATTRTTSNGQTLSDESYVKQNASSNRRRGGRRWRRK